MIIAQYSYYYALKRHNFIQYEKKWKAINEKSDSKFIDRIKQ